MKKICESCQMGIKNKAACQARKCIHAEPVKVKKVKLPKYKFPMRQGDQISCHLSFRLEIFRMDEKTGDFVGKLLNLNDADQSCGHFGSYVKMGRYYKFNLISESKDHSWIMWEVPEEGTERFHREGSTGAQFLLSWNKGSGFCFDLDS